MGRLSWLVWTGPECNHGVLIRGSRGRFAQKRRGGKNRQRLELGGHEPRNASSHQKLQVTRNRSSPGASRRTQPSQYLAICPVRFSLGCGLWSGGKIHLCCFKSPSLWSFVTGDLRHGDKVVIKMQVTGSHPQRHRTWGQRLCILGKLFLMVAQQSVRSVCIRTER